MPSSPSILRRCLQGGLIAVFSAVLVLPAAQQATGHPREKRLGGFRYRFSAFPAWTWTSWTRGEYSSTVEAWTQEHVGLRGWLVHINRQLRYSLFGQAEAAPLRKRALVIGAPPVLYENILLADALRPPQIAPDRMETLAARLARTQTLLRRQGMAFVVIVAPNKALIYTESLPGWARGRVRDDHTDYKPFVEALGRHRVPCLDTMALFRELKPQHTDLIPPHAIHWGHHGAWIAWQRTVPLLNGQGLPVHIPVPETEALVMDHPTSMNQELLGQLNVFFSRHGDPIPSAYPVAADLPEGVEPMLDVLVVGDSFGFTFADALSRSRLCRSIDFWFYMKTERRATPSFDSRRRRLIPNIDAIGALTPSDENGRRVLAGKNVVILLMTTFNIDKETWGFDRLVNRLYGDPRDDLPLSDLPEVRLDD